jgi:hypothetical protein
MMMFVFVIMVMVVVMIMVVVMVMVMVVMMVLMGLTGGMERQMDILGQFLFPVDQHLHMGAGDAAGRGGLALDGDAGDPQGVHLRHKGVGVHQLGQRRHQHIAGRAHFTFEIQCFHDKNPFYNGCLK